MPNIDGIHGSSFPERSRFGQVSGRDAKRGRDGSDGTDRVDLSASARRLAGESQTDEIRMDKVMAVRAAIAAGTYETPEKLNTAVDRMIEELLA